LLDVGCGTGEFVQDALAQGWDAEGIESSRRAAEFARDRKKLPVAHAVLKNASCTSQSFAVVTFLDVLEHLRDPREEMLRAKRLLREDGIVVVRLPNTNFHLLKCRICDALHVTDHGLQMRYHLNHFTPSTTKKLLRQVGFDPLDIDVGTSETISHAPWASHRVKRLYVGAATWVKSFTGLNFGNILVAYARKIS
jgi:2-polyprenyl-3-methyl-5-hydroxy-6-metoxy-1,4-benzoquinol methylase